MVKYKIVIERGNCIGAFSCVAVGGGEDLLEMDEVEGKINLIVPEAVRDSTTHELITEDKELINQIVKSGEVCPVSVIKVINIETGENLVK